MNVEKTKIFLCLVLISVTCNLQAQHTDVYKDNVGDIVYDSLTDKPSFSLTGEKIMQYYNFFSNAAIKGENSFLLDFYNKRYIHISCKYSGYITIRFVVNYLGETDRFRLQQMDLSLQYKEFPKKMTSQLLFITKEIYGWKVAESKGVKYDYYQYLTFVINEGDIKMILP